jgi:putative hydrolase of the HAD superfamily
VINTKIIKDIFFDLDHTLWDFEKNSALTFKFIFNQFNFSLDIENFLIHYTPINHACWKLYRENKISHKELRIQRLVQTFKKIKFDISLKQIEEISELYITHLSSFTYLFDGTLDFINGLKNKYKLHIITNGFEEVQNFKVVNSGLKTYFQNIFTAEKIGFKKPHPRIFLTAIESVNTSAYNSIMIGDSLEADIQGALDVGMQAIHFNTHNELEHNQCPIVYSMDELNQIFI